MTVENVAASVVIATGNFRAVLNTSGSDLFASLSLDGVDKALAGRLVLQFQDKPDNVDGLSAPNITQAYGNIEKVEVEKSGPVSFGAHSPSDYGSFAECFPSLLFRSALSSKSLESITLRTRTTPRGYHSLPVSCE